jgi:DNA-binding FrmR family transcriptional regulator
MDPGRHTSHAAIVKRLNKAIGHLSTIVKMIESERSCVDLAQQLHAVERAVAAAKKTLIHDHIEHCLEVPEGDTQGAKSTLEELKILTKYL